MIKAVVFDCFGVVIADVLRARRESVSKVDPVAGQAMSDIVKASNRGMTTREEAAKQMAEILGVDYKQILTDVDNGEVKNDELITFIKTLRPTYKLAMLSNVRSRERLDQLFDPGELDQLFDTVVASGDVGFIKPEREIYEMAAEQLGVLPQECVMIDDIREYCDGAEDAGMRSIQFTSTEQAIADFAALIDTESEKY